MPWLTADKHQEEVEAARDIVLRRLGRSSAPRAALAELLDRKEVAPHVAEEVLDRLESAGVVDDAAYAATLARKKLAATRGLDPLVRRRRALALLGRKGYSHEVAMRAIEQALAGQD